MKSYLNDALDEVRKAELNKARKDEEQKELAGLLHCKQRFILMWIKPSRKKTQVLKRLATLNETVYKAMLLKDQFAATYELKTRKEAQNALKIWIGEALRSGLSLRGETIPPSTHRGPALGTSGPYPRMRPPACDLHPIYPPHLLPHPPDG